MKAPSEITSVHIPPLYDLSFISFFLTQSSPCIPHRRGNPYQQYQLSEKGTLWLILGPDPEIKKHTTSMILTSTHQKSRSFLSYFLLPEHTSSSCLSSLCLFLASSFFLSWSSSSLPAPLSRFVSPFVLSFSLLLFLSFFFYCIEMCVCVLCMRLLFSQVYVIVNLCYKCLVVFLVTL